MQREQFLVVAAGVLSQVGAVQGAVDSEAPVDVIPPEEAVKEEVVVMAGGGLQVGVNWYVIMLLLIVVGVVVYMKKRKAVADPVSPQGKEMDERRINVYASDDGDL